MAVTRNWIVGVLGCGKAECKDGLAGLVGDLYRPFLPRQCAVEVAQHLAGCPDRFWAHGVQIRDVYSLLIRTIAAVVDVEKVARQQWRCLWLRRERDASLSHQRLEIQAGDGSYIWRPWVTCNVIG